MSDTGQILGQIDRLTNSSVLHGSESLCRLLRYLATQALNHPGAHVKEYQIATEVFGRPSDFDPQLDSTIRVQAGRLRGKLTEYYAGEGAHDPIVVELPKGSYLLSFHQRNGGATAVSAEAAASPKAPASRGAVMLIALLCVLLAISGLIIGKLLLSRTATAPSEAREIDSGLGVLRTFWNPFLTGPEEPWVIFSNAAFVGRPETGMRYFDSARDAKSPIWDHYTGVGEVLGMHSLDQVFAGMSRQIRVKRGSLFSLDDAKNNDLIFLGSPSENLTLQDLPTTREFIFQRLSEGSRKGDLAIVNVHPQHGEPQECLASPSDAPLTEDYFVVALMPGLNPVRSILILAGTTTFGTQAAAEFVSRSSSVNQLLSRLLVADGGSPKPFEALVRAKIVRGVPVESELLAVHSRSR